MAGRKITEKAAAADIKSGASFLITQPEGVVGSEVESVRRAGISAVVSALRGSGIMNGYSTTAQVDALEAQVDALEAQVDALETQVADLEYTPIAITSFVIATPASGIAEIGSAVHTEVLRWTLEGTPVSQTINGIARDINSREVTLAGPGNYYTSDYDFVLVVTDAGSPSHAATTAQKTATLHFYNRVCYGAAALGTVDSAFVNGLANKLLTGGKARTITVNAGSGQYIWYAVPTRLGQCSFKVGGFEGGFESPVTVSVTNSAEYAESYYVYRSTNSALGQTTVVVS